MRISQSEYEQFKSAYNEYTHTIPADGVLRILSIEVDSDKLEWTKPELHQLGKSDFKLPLEVYVLYCKTAINNTQEK
jgi:hypothetical protein